MLTAAATGEPCMMKTSRILSRFRWGCDRDGRGVTPPRPFLFSAAALDLLRWCGRFHNAPRSSDAGRTGQCAFSLGAASELCNAANGEPYFVSHFADRRAVALRRRKPVDRLAELLLSRRQERFMDGTCGHDAVSNGSTNTCGKSARALGTAAPRNVPVCGQKFFATAPGQRKRVSNCIGSRRPTPALDTPGRT